MTTRLACYHCDLPLVDGQVFYAQVLSESRPMCCPGCKAVAEAIVENGLEDYYRFRTEPGQKSDGLLDETLQKLAVYDQAELQEEFVYHTGEYQQIQLTVEGISCPACAWLIEKQLGKLTGVKQISVNVAARRAMVIWAGDQLKLSQILAQMEKIGYHALPFQADQHEASYQREQKVFLKRIGLAGLMSMQVMMLAIGLYFGVFGSIDPQTQRYFHWVSLFLTLPVVGYSGLGFYLSAFKAVKIGSVNMDLSVSLAILGTFVSSAWATISGQGDVYFESVCMFIFLLLLSRYLEHLSRYRASQISANMLKYMPVTATLIEADNTVSCLAKQLKPGQQVLVKAGETIPADAEVLKGHSDVDESMLTGEFDPVSKKPGDVVYGGTVNRSGSLVLRVKTSLKYALVNQIVHMQEQALVQKPKAAVFADRASRYFVWVVLLLATASYLVWQHYDAERAFWIAIAVLVATCPCALSLATPSALTSAMARLNQQGLLLKRADVLEQVPEINTVVLDKTGTLTEGQFSLARSQQLVAEQPVMSIAATLEAYSEHPIAVAFNSETPLLPVQSVKIETGNGVKGVIGEMEYRIGAARFMTQPVPEHLAWASVFLQDETRLLAAFALEDKVRDDAKSLITRLAGKKLVLLSGDNRKNVRQVAESLGIQDFVAEQSPAQKLAYLRSLQQQGKRVMMVGDGINDAPVLALADVSVAMGNAADMAKRSADLVLIGKQLSSLSSLFALAARSRSKIKQNMAWAIGYNVLVLPLAISGWLTPWMAVIGMSLSSIIVVVNSTRLLHHK